MGLRCSLIGHDWGESEIERDREENGSEVVLTVREYEVCGRCGERNLISENTEVTTLSTGEDAPERAPEPTRDDGGAGDAPASPPASEDDAPAESVDEPAPDAPATDDAVSPSTGSDLAADAPGEDDAEVFGDADADADATPAAEGDAAVADDADVGTGEDDAVFIDDAEDEPEVATAEDVIGSAEEPVDDAVPGTHDESAPETESVDVDSDDVASAVDANDDGVIMDDDADADAEADRDHGEWPEHEDDVAPNERAEGASAAATEESVAGDASPSADVEATTVEDEDGAYDAEFIDGDTETDANADTSAESAPSESPSGIKSAGTTAPPGERHTRDGELVCPNCSNAETADRTSLRAGDICPECRKGYLSNPGE